MTSLPEEILFFARLSAYALFIGTVYWFVSYEVAGTVMLVGFGIAAGVATLVLFWRSPAQAKLGGRTMSGHPSASPSELRPDGPFGDDGGRVPMGSLAPLGIGAGIAVVTFGLVFGPWLVLAGLVLALASAGGWLGEVVREWQAHERSG